MKKIIYFFVILTLFAKCIDTDNKNKLIDTKNLAAKIQIQKKESKDSQNAEPMVEITRITQEKYNKLKSNKIITHEKPKKITDFEKVKLMLTNRVALKTEGDRIVKIIFKDGKEISPEDEECYFIAYYPSEDILLLEGGHMSDVSYNLTTGESTEFAGNPNYIVSSPSHKFRLNGSFGGQECIEYFIQRNLAGRFKKIISVNQLFSDKIRKDGLCYFENYFWSGDSTFNFVISNRIEDPVVVKNEYFQLKINIPDNEL